MAEVVVFGYYFVILHSNCKIMKKATTIEEQIKRLRDRNVTIVDEERRRRIFLILATIAWDSTFSLLRSLIHN